jgi:SNF2 family DNA or RNA helicase
MHGLSPKEYPTRTKYVDRYGLLSWNAFGGMDIIGIRPDTKDEFYSILDPRMRRMPKDLVLPFLPPKVPIRRFAEMGSKQAKQYEQMTKDLIAQLDGGLLLSTNPLAQLTRLVQFSSSCADVIETADLTTGSVSVKVRLTGPSNKVDELENLIDDLPPGEPLVVMAASRQLIMLANTALESKKIETRLIVGGMTEDQRQNSIDDFQSGRAQVILCTIAAGGSGLTLTRSRTVVFLQRSWSMIDNLQAVDRVHRIGSQVHESIRVVDIISPGTVEEKQLAMLREKEQRLEEILRDRNTLTDELFRLVNEGADPERIAKLQNRIGEIEGSVRATEVVKLGDLRALLR